MPISPENMKLYPGGSIRSPEWLAIRERIRGRADDRCEGCNVENSALGGRLPNGAWLPAIPKGEKRTRIQWPEPGEVAWCSNGLRADRLRIVKIVCTVAHFYGELSDHSDENLRFWCQRCHNRHDAASRQKNAAATRRKANAAGDLFAGAPA